MLTTAAAAGHRSLDVQVHLTVAGAETWAPMVYDVPTMDGYCESCRLVGKQTHDMMLPIACGLCPHQRDSVRGERPAACGNRSEEEPSAG